MDAQRSDIPPELQAQLKSFRTQLWKDKVSEAILAGLLGLLFSFVLVFVLDRLLPTPGWLRLLLLLGGTSLFIGFAPYWLHRWLYKNRRDGELAQLLAKKFPRLGDRLRGVLELSTHQEDEAEGVSPALRAAATRDVAREAAKRNFIEALPQNRTRPALVAAGVLVAVVVSFFVFLPKAGLNAFQRWLLPLSDTPRYTLTRFDKNLPEELIVPLGRPFTLDVPLAKDTEQRPGSARARFGAQSWRESPRDETRYRFDFPGQRNRGVIQLTAGDARARVAVRPVLPPTLEEVSATLTLPNYLQREPENIVLRSGSANLLVGSELALAAKASRTLRSGEIQLQEDADAPEEEKPESKALAAEVSGAQANYPPITIGEQRQSLRLSWTDTYGLAGDETFRLQIEPSKDLAPTLYIQGVARQLAILPEETLEFEVSAQDDYGLTALGLEWQGEFTKPSPGEPASGENELQLGSPTAQTLSQSAVFSPAIYQIGPQKLVLRAYTQDYLPERGRIYSQPITLYILNRDEHAQMLKDRFDRILGELEDVAREEQTNLDENKRLADLDEEELLSEATQQKLQEQLESEAENREKLEELDKEMEQLFKDALRNGEIEKETMQQLSETEQKLGELAEEDLPAVEKELGEAQDESSTSEQKKKDLDEAVQKQEEALEKMRETLEEANKTAEELEAATFVNRLKAAAKDHDAIASSLVESLEDLAGLRVEDIEPAGERFLSEVQKQQKETNSALRWIKEDLTSFYARTQKEIHLELLEEMREAKLENTLQANQNRLLNNLTFRGIYFSKQWAQQLRDWAKMLEGDAAAGAGGGGGGGGSSPEDQDFEFMLRVMKLIQSEQDVRARTRAIEQLRRSLQPPPNTDQLP